MRYPISTMIPLLKVDAAALGIAIAATVLVGAVVFVPIFQSRAEQDDLTRRLDNARQSFERTSDVIGEQQRLLRATAAELAASPVQPQPLSSLNQRLDRIAALTAEHGLTLEAINAGEVISTPKTQSIPIKIAGKCEVASCQALLRSLRTQFPDTAVIALLLARQDVGEDTSTAGSPPAGPTSRFTMELIWHAAAPSAAPAQSVQPATAGIN